MIPYRVLLSGFLSYKEEQVIYFADSSLWMLTGVNGSGKSAIFDALTYALFGHHRGGSQTAQELINKESKGLIVEFDFWIEKVLFRIRRTYRRDPRGGGKGTQQILRRELHAQTGAEQWVPVLDVNKKVEFESWIKDKIGLNYETFTSSVLLLQGRAEKLLDSTPRGRAEVLASIVDLERFQRLHEKADNRRKGLKAELEALQNQRSGIPEVSDFEWANAEGEITREEDNRQRAIVEVDRLQQREFDARKWVDLQGRLHHLREKWQQAEALVAESTRIEKDYHRLRELREVLPHVTTIQQAKSEIEESLGRSKGLMLQQEKVLESKTKTEHTVATAKKKRASLQSQWQTDEARRTEVEGKLRNLSGVLVKVKMFEEQQNRCLELQNQLDQLPADPLKAVAAAQKLLEQRIELGNVVPLLERFARQRGELAGARKRAETAQADETRVRAVGEELGKKVKDLTARLETATKNRQEADQRATETNTLLEQAQIAAKEFHKLDGKKVCRACGQKLTAAHFKEEKAKREKELAAAEHEAEVAAKAQTKAQAEEQAARTAFKTTDDELAKRREEYRERKAEAAQAQKDAERCGNECKESYQSISEDYRRKIAAKVPADWSTTTYPAETDLAVLRRDVGDLKALRKRAEEAQQTLSQWEKLQGQLTLAKQTCDQLRSELPKSDPVSLRSEHTSLQADETSLNNSLKGLRVNLVENESEIERLNKDLTRIQQQIADVANALNREEDKRKHQQDSIERARRVLPEAWRAQCDAAGLGEQHQWKVEQDELLAKQTESRYQGLATARAGVENLRQEILTAETEANAFPAESRGTPEEVQALLREAKARVKQCDLALEQASKQKGILDHHRELRKEIDGKLLSLDREHNYYVLLAQLLGRDRLQRHLVREAERQIIDYSNAVLDRLSAGQLFLRLCGSEEGTDTTRALELEAYNRATGESPINVAFLSGSQRFRVAVSLALGIGQYASRQHRPIESVIIDEGFGCLDRNGRQVMIQEMQNLRGQLRCILLVSHQEEFADAFPDGYRFELSNGATRISRIQR